MYFTGEQVIGLIFILGVYLWWILDLKYEEREEKMRREYERQLKLRELVNGHADHSNVG